MYTAKDITDEHRTEFAKLNVTNTEDMLIILNGLDYMAEIGYVAYTNNRINQSNHND